ncbi:MAG: 50S ribosomal protein L17 [Bacteroidales bacterium]|nr:50S ribosomal protein L17 [Bacteroidales bacterium]
MRHNKKFNHLGRKSAHRKAMLSNMATSLILKKRIITTTAKAKALRMYVEPLITRSKPENNTTTEQGTTNRRVVFSYLQNKYAVTELFREVGPKVGNRPGGYTRIIRMPENRLGDAAEMAMMELVDYNENLLNVDKKAGKAKTTRRSSKKAPKAEAAAAPAAETTTTEAPAEEVKE